MSARITKQSGGKLTIEVDMDLNGSMLSQEEAIQVALNEAGKLATLTAMKNFDTDGHPIIVRQERLTSKGIKKSHSDTLWQGRLASPRLSDKPWRSDLLSSGS